MKKKVKLCIIFSMIILLILAILIFTFIYLNINLKNENKLSGKAVNDVVENYSTNERYSLSHSNSNNFYYPLNEEKYDNYVKGDLIIKLKKEVTINEKSAVSKGASYVKSLSGISSSNLESNKASLNSLFEKHKAREYKKVFEKQVRKIEINAIKSSESSREEELDRIILIKVENTENALNDFKEEPDIEYAEPNYIYEINFIPNDPLYSQQWAHKNTQTEAGWDIEKGNPNIIIAVIDTGVDWNHEDLRDNIWNNPGEIAGNNIDDDGNGYIDDVRGWDFTNTSRRDYCTNDCAGEDNDPMDEYGHGTHVSGIIAAKGNNNLGVIGVCPNCKIMALRSAGMTEVEISNAIYYAANNGANIISMSFGRPASLFADLPWTINRALQYANFDKKVILVAAAGNSNSDILHYPAAFQDVISVAATDSLNQKASYSNYGSWVDIAAPGTNILSTISTSEAYSNSNLIVYPQNKKIESNSLLYSGRTTLDGIIGEIVYAGLGREEDFVGINVSGKIALVERGEITFRHKSGDAKEAGAIGIIIYNNEPGNFLGNLFQRDVDTIPAISISQEDGNYLKNTNSSAKLIVEEAKYMYMSGTSMAAPYVAGVLGLIKSKNKNLSTLDSERILKKGTNTLDDAENLIGNEIYMGGITDINKTLNINYLPPLGFLGLSLVYPADTYFSFGYIKEKNSNKFIPIWSIYSKWHELDVGNYTLKITKRGFLDYYKNIEINNKYTKLNISLSANIKEGILRKISNAGNSYNVFIKDNYIVWEQRSAGGCLYSIVLYGLKNNTSKIITCSNEGAFLPKIDNNKVYWLDGRNGGYDENNRYKYDIYKYDILDQKEERITNSPIPISGFSVYGDKIAWRDLKGDLTFIGIFGDIYLFDIPSKTEEKITDQTKSLSNPWIYKNKVVYEEGAWIRIYDIETGNKMVIMSNVSRGGGAYRPILSNNKIVWVTRFNYGYLHDLYTNKTKEIYDAGGIYPISSPYISEEGNIVFLDEWGKNIPALVYYDSSDKLSKDKISIMTDYNKSKMSPIIWKNKIVWSQDDDGNYSVYLFELNNQNKYNSMIINNALSPITGTLTLILQNKSSTGIWQTLQSVASKQISIPAQGSYNFASDWNNANIKPSLAGDYRVLARFDSAGKVKEAYYEFKVQ